MPEIACNPKVYLFGWPSDYGGAATKVAALIPILADICQLTVVPNAWVRLKEKHWQRFLERYGVTYCLEDELPTSLKGIALAFCQERFFVDGVALRAKERGLKIAWSSEMMWHMDGEIEAAQNGLLDSVLFVSQFQERALRKNYGNIPAFQISNYIDSSLFPFTCRTGARFTIGRLSRADETKFTEDFPTFYECLEIPSVQYRVMSWSDHLTKKYQWHRFGPEWQLLKHRQETSQGFLQSLSAQVYRPGHRCQESWGRAIIEGTLTGSVCVVPKGHAFSEIVLNRETGFLCDDVLEYKEVCQRLYRDRSLLQRISKQGASWARSKFCNHKAQRKLWRSIFEANQ